VRNGDKSAQGLSRNLAALYVLHAANYLLPLLVIPYLLRVLGPEQWGVVAVMQSFAFALAAVVEFGFNFWGTRAAARSRGKPARLGYLVAAITSAKILLALAAITAAWLLRGFLPALGGNTTLFWGAVLWGAGQSFNVLWYFQGLERAGAVASLDLLLRLSSTCSIFLLIHLPGDYWKVLYIYAAAAWLCSACGIWILRAEIKWRSLGFRLAWGTLRRARSMFGFRVSESISESGMPLLLAWFVPAETVGFYAAAEKIIRPFATLVDPLTRSVYPRLTYLFRIDRSAALALVRRLLTAVSIAGLAIAALITILSSSIIRLFMGPGYDPAIPMLRVLAMLPLIAGLKHVFGVCCMLPQRMESVLNLLVLSGAVFQALLIALLAARYPGTGAALAVLIGAALVPAASYAWLRFNQQAFVLIPAEGGVKP
jgi:PST family polysaccharide transporter